MAHYANSCATMLALSAYSVNPLMVHQLMYNSFTSISNQSLNICDNANHIICGSATLDPELEHLEQTCEQETLLAQQKMRRAVVGT